MTFDSTATFCDWPMVDSSVRSLDWRDLPALHPVRAQGL